MNNNNCSILVIIAFLFFSCADKSKTNISSLLAQWENKQVLFPSNATFTLQGKDTVAYQMLNDGYKILNYVDSLGCMSCKLHLEDWLGLMKELDSISMNKFQSLFFFVPKKGTEIYQTLRVAHFDYPVCIDEQDSLNILNHFPSDPRFQTFLLDKNNRVVAIGNPVHNPKVKELYMKIIKGEKELQSSSVASQTQVSLNTASLDLGTFSSAENQKGIFQLKNTGNKPLVINAVTTSCGCTQVAYEKQPISPGGTTHLTVNYKADHPEHFNKTIVVHCNAKESPIQLTITGDAR